jgi:hypothetical protein
MNLYGWSKHLFDLAVVERARTGGRMPPQWAGLKFLMLWLAEHQHVSGIFNVGTGVASSFKDTITALFAALGRGPNIEYVDMPLAIRNNREPRLLGQFTDRARLRRLGQVIEMAAANTVVSVAGNGVAQGPSAVDASILQFANAGDAITTPNKCLHRRRAGLLYSFCRIYGPSSRDNELKLWSKPARIV